MKITFNENDEKDRKEKVHICTLDDVQRLDKLPTITLRMVCKDYVKNKQFS